MKLANHYPVPKPLDARKTDKKSDTGQNTLKKTALKQAIPQNILFGTSPPPRLSPTLRQDMQRLEQEIQALENRAPRIFGKPFVPKSMKPILKKRALYNLSADPAELVEFLPYRQKLVGKNEHQDLRQYDQLVAAIMDKAEFYEAEKITLVGKAVSNLQNNILNNVLNEKPEKQGITPKNSIAHQNGVNNIWHKIRYFLSIVFYPKNNLQRRQTQSRTTYTLGSRIFKLIPDQTLLKQLTQSGLKPLADPSTRYLIASSITELLFKNPEQAKNLLNNPKHPLRFVVGKEASKFTLGQFRPGLNLIFLKEDDLWNEALKKTKKSYTSQHEFVHAMADSTNGETLPAMSTAQKDRFLKARTELETLFSKKDAGITGFIRRLWNRHTATGLRYYAFHNRYEFLTVTSDTFKSQPEELCRTQAGRDIYQIYKEIFGIDPLEDFKQA